MFTWYCKYNFDDTCNFDFDKFQSNYFIEYKELHNNLNFNHISSSIDRNRMAVLYYLVRCSLMVNCIC